MEIAEKGISERVEKLLKLYKLPIRTKYKSSSIISAAKGDKKRAGDSIVLVLPQKIGSCILKKVSFSKVEEYVKEGR